jgi:hypothetical protein
MPRPRRVIGRIGAIFGEDRDAGHVRALKEDVLHPLYAVKLRFVAAPRTIPPASSLWFRNLEETNP